MPDSAPGGGQALDPDRERAQRAQRLRELFDTASELPIDERAAWIMTACSDDEPLGNEVLELLAAGERSGATWTHPLGNAIASALGDKITRGRQVSYASGSRIGVYELIRLIGTGGMGAVYEGVRVDDQFSKRVALKFLRRDSEGDLAIRRFRYERQILANLNHRNIAALLDGGVTDDGQPYLVMEYVEGEPLTTWANERKLSLRERVRLLRQVCAAVQHAHQHFVVHRDLKPGNILVTADGSVKLLDFGIARLTRAVEDFEQLPVTQLGALAFTPEYASPEQARGTHVTVSSDIYSLGVIASELLSGKRPYSTEGMLFADMQRVIAESPATAPSALASEESAANCGTSRSRLKKLLSGDLDAVILQALRKEPERRYGSVEQFSTDLQRFLDGLPVSARRDTLAYRTRKFLERRRLEVAAACLVVASLVGGIVTTNHQARRAELERRKMEQVNTFLTNMLSSVDPEQGGPDVTVNEVLSDAANRIQEGNLEPEVEAQIRHTIGQTFYALGLFDSATPHLDRALELRRRLFGDLDQRTTASLSYVAALAEVRGDFAVAESLARVIVGDQRRMPRAQADSTELATALDNLARMMEQQGKLNEALRIKLESIAIRRLIPADSASLAALPYTLQSVATSYMYDGDVARADSLLKEAAQVEERVHGPESFNMGGILRAYANLLGEMDRYPEADSVINRSVGILSRAAGPNHYETLRSKTVRAQLLFEEGDMPATVQAARAVTAQIGLGMPESDITSSVMLQVLGLALDSLKQYAAADSALLRSRNLRYRFLPPDHWATASAEAVYGRHLLRGARYAEGEKMMREAYDKLVELRGSDAGPTKNLAKQLAEFYESRGNQIQASHWRELAR